MRRSLWRTCSTGWRRATGGCGGATEACGGSWDSGRLGAAVFESEVIGVCELLSVRCYSVLARVLGVQEQPQGSADSPCTTDPGAGTVVSGEGDRLRSLYYNGIGDEKNTSHDGVNRNGARN